MTAAEIKRNLTPTQKPSVIDVLGEYLNQLMIDFNCHHLATIQAFDPIKQTVQVSIDYQQTHFVYTGNPPIMTANLVPYPQIRDVPVIILSGGTVNLTFPIKVGDQCMLLFNDRDIDNWYSGTTTAGNQSSRLHAFSDAVALVGLKNLNTKIANYDPDRALLSNGTVKNGINPTNNKLTLTNGTSLNTLLQNLCTQIENLCTKLESLKVLSGALTVSIPALDTPTLVTGISGIPIPATITDLEAIKTSVTNIATQIGNLIE